MQTEISEDDYEAMQSAKGAKYWQDIDERDEFVESLNADDGENASRGQYWYMYE